MNDARGAGAFVAPAWLRGAGTASWLLVGVLLVVIGAVALLAITHVIVMPVLTAAVVAAVISPSSPGSQDMAFAFRARSCSCLRSSCSPRSLHSW